MFTRTAMRTVFAPLALAAALALTGCLSAREEALRMRMPQNHVFTPVEMLGEMEENALALVNRSETQSVCLLRLPTQSKIEKTFHVDMDLTLVVVQGTAAVAMEEARYVVEPGDTVVVPRLTAYSIIPHAAEQPFAAVAVFSPDYDPLDINRAE